MPIVAWIFALIVFLVLVYGSVTCIVADATCSAVVNLDRATCGLVLSAVFMSWKPSQGPGDLNYSGVLHPRVSVYFDGPADEEQAHVTIDVSPTGGAVRRIVARFFFQAWPIMAMLKLGYYSDDPLEMPLVRERRLARRLLGLEQYAPYQIYQDEIYEQLEIELRGRHTGDVDLYDVHDQLSLSRIVNERYSYKKLPVELDENDRNAIEAALLRAMNKTLGASGRLAFPLTAPRLVELDSDDSIAVSSFRELTDFISSHQASAVGISGPRGSGKSTLLRAVTAHFSDSPRVSLPVQVSYDREQFTRRLVLQVLTALEDELAPPTRRASIRPSLARISLALAGLTAVALGTLGLTRRYRPDIGMPLSIAPTNLAAAWSLVGAGLFALILVVVAQRVQRRRYEIEPPESLLRIREFRDHLASDTEQTSMAKASAKAWTFVEVGGERSRKTRRRAFGQVDLVTELRDVLTDAVFDTVTETLIICIDELDKVADPKDAVDTVNSLKDLFHVRGVHFLVTVSDEALATFAERSILPRDAFDSAFDTIIEVRAFTSTESVDLIQSRATGFPPALAVFCHAWSGGLPREILRTARRCIEIQRSESDSLPLPQLLGRLIVDDSLSLIESTLRNSRIGERSRDDLEDLRASMRSALAADVDALVLASTIPDPRGVSDQIVGAATRRCQIGLLLVALAHTFSGRQSWWTGETGELAQQADALACAVRSTGLFGALRDDPFDDVVSALSSTLKIEPPGPPVESC